MPLNKDEKYPFAVYAKSQERFLIAKRIRKISQKHLFSSSLLQVCHAHRNEDNHLERHVSHCLHGALSLVWVGHTLPLGGF